MEVRKYDKKIIVSTGEKMMRRKLLLVFCLSLFLGATPAMAAMFGPDGGSELQGVLESITVGGPSSVDVTTDELADTELIGTPYDSYWSVTGNGMSSATLIIELAGFANSNRFGLFDKADHTRVVEVFDGAASAGNQAVISIKADGSVYLNVVNDTDVDFAGNMFGYYLDSPEGRFYSDTDLNPDQVDHMYAYQGNDVDTVQLPGLLPGTWTDNEFILAFEDLYGGGDNDFSDFVLMVESVEPVPVPGAVLLGMLGLGAVGIRLRKFA